MKMVMIAAGVVLGVFGILEVIGFCLMAGAMDELTHLQEDRDQEAFLREWQKKKES